MSFTVYRSSAGSGKTFSLVREYLKIILLHPGEYRHILAITFTNKAANEMKDRVLKTLNALSNTEEGRERDLWMPVMIAETGLPCNEIRLRATQALSLMLHHYSDVAIGTIDSFSQKIIRTFAYDFGLPVSFNVSIDTNELLTTAVDLVLDKMGEDEELTALMMNFVGNRMDDDRGWNIDQMLVKFASVLQDEEGQQHMVRLHQTTLPDFRRIIRTISKRMDAFETNIRSIGEQATLLIRRNGLAHSDFYQGSYGISRYFEDLSAGRMDKLHPNSHVLNTIEADRWTSRKTSSADCIRINELKHELTEYYQKIQSIPQEEKESYTLYTLLAKNLFQLALLNEIDRVLTDFKQQQHLVHISEFNTRIARIVMGEPVPFIYERLGEKYHHIFIDEFQDTSRLQWQNFVPLIENALASGYFNLIVGDGKQAIYRWRNGDVTQFSQLPALYKSHEDRIIFQREKVLKDHYHSVRLERNFRSRAELVSFNNRFFRHITENRQEIIKQIYEDVVQESLPEKTGGYIQIRLSPAGLPIPELAEITFRHVFDTIQSVVHDGYQLKDVAILCRKNIQASLLARKLISTGIDVVSSESLLVTHSPEVTFLISFLRFLFDPGNLVIQAELLAYLFRSQRLGTASLDETLHALHQPVTEQPALLKILQEYGWNMDPDYLLSLPVYDLCEELIRRFELTPKPDPYIQFFLDAVVDFISRDVNSTCDLLEWWEENKKNRSIQLPEGVNAVRIMTIHKAKGLQFPVVIYPYAIDTKKKGVNSFWVELDPENIPGLPTAIIDTSKELLKTRFQDLYDEEDQKSTLDLINLLYVVLTRAEDRMYILSTCLPDEKELPVSIPGFFTGFLRSDGKWDEGNRIYEYGIPEPMAPNEGTKENDAIFLRSFISNDWRSKIHIRARSSELWDRNTDDERRFFGNQVHSILSRIKSSDDLEKTLREAVSSGLILHEEVEQVREMILQLVRHPELGNLFSRDVTVKTEAGIIMPDGQLFRPDRVVFDRDQVYVIEYKTGKRDERHVQQLKQYTELLHQMGYSSIHSYLVYLHKVMEVLSV